MLALASALVAVSAAMLVSAPAASASPADTITDLANEARAAAGTAPLARNANLASVARAWARRMAADGRLWHTPDLANQIPSGWRRIGENVAQGYRTGAQMHSGWMGSSGHRANILGDFTDIGVAFLESGGTTWGVQVFASYPNGSGARPAPAPTATRTTEPSRSKPSATATVRKPASTPRTPAASRTPKPSPTTATPTPTRTTTPTPTPTATASQTDDAVAGVTGDGPGDDAVTEVAADTAPGRAVDPLVVAAVGVAALLAAAVVFAALRRRALSRTARHRG